MAVVLSTEEDKYDVALISHWLWHSSEWLTR